MWLLSPRLLAWITSGTPVLPLLLLESDGVKETVGRQYCKRDSQIFLCQQHQSQVRYVHRQLLLYVCLERKGSRWGSCTSSTERLINFAEDKTAAGLISNDDRV